MTETLRDLLHEAVSDADMPDVSDLAWAAGGRARRRRAVSVVAGVVAVTMTVGGVAWAVDRRDGPRAGQPIHAPLPSTPTTAAPAPHPPGAGEAEPDGEYRGTAVWWAPSVAQEGSLPAYRPGVVNPLPTTIDLSAPDSAVAGEPVGLALASFAVYAADGSLSSVHVLGADGLLRRVDLVPATGKGSPIKPMADPEGNQRIQQGFSMLSPSGEYLMFPQDGFIRLLRLDSQQWSSIDTGAHSTWDATWTADDLIALLDPERADPHPPVYDVTGLRVPRAGATDDLVPRWDGDLYGLPRRSPGGSLAQSYTSGADVPQPPALHLSPGQSDWIGVASAPDAILVLPQETARWKQCCQVAGWLDRSTLVYESRSSDGLRLVAWRMGTARFWQVSQIVGWTPGEDTVVSSYARLFPAEDCCSG
jgi:hypothetical protein